MGHDMTTTKLDLHIIIVYTPPDDYIGSDALAYNPKQAFEIAARWLKAQLENIPDEMKCSLIVAVKENDE